MKINYLGNNGYMDIPFPDFLDATVKAFHLSYTKDVFVISAAFCFNQSAPEKIFKVNETMFELELPFYAVGATQGEFSRMIVQSTDNTNQLFSAMVGKINLSTAKFEDLDKFIMTTPVEIHTHTDKKWYIGSVCGVIDHWK